MKNNSCRFVLYVVEDTQAVQFRYRVKNVVEALEGGSKWTARYILKNDLKRIDYGKVDLLVIERQTAKDNKILKMIKEAHAAHVRVLFDLDDLVFDYKDLRLVVNSVKEKSIFYFLGYFWGVRRIARRVDGFIVTNEFLGDKLKRSFGKKYGIIPNSLNREQVETSKKCLANKNHRGFVIGYFAGSSTHTNDFRLAEQSLARFLKIHDDAKLLIVGRMKFSNEIKDWIKKGKIEVIKPVNYLKLQSLISKVDVNIAPLVVNDFTNCKSELKFFEAAAVETTTIASPTYTFKKAINDGENGFLAYPGEWYDKLEYLYQHPKKNHEVAVAARKYALEHYYGPEFLKEVEEAYDYFAK